MYYKRKSEVHNPTFTRYCVFLPLVELSRFFFL